MKYHILIAEDDLHLTKLYRAHLENTGFEVTITQTGDETIEMMDKCNVDILLLDLLMPVVDGFAVLEHYKAKKYTFPIIILSNVGRKSDKDRCRELGAKVYFVKSDIGINDLVELIDKFL